MEIKDFPRCLKTTGRDYRVCYDPQGIYTTQALSIISSKAVVRSQQGDGDTDQCHALRQSGAVRDSSADVCNT